MTTFMLALLAFLAILCATHVLTNKDDFLYVNITILQSATAQGAGSILRFLNYSKKTKQILIICFNLSIVCLDGSPPAYHLHRGYGTGFRSWIIYLEVNY